MLIISRDGTWWCMVDSWHTPIMMHLDLPHISPYHQEWMYVAISIPLEVWTRCWTTWDHLFWDNINLQFTKNKLGVLLLEQGNTLWGCHIIGTLSKMGWHLGAISFHIQPYIWQTLMVLTYDCSDHPGHTAKDPLHQGDFTINAVTHS